MHSDYWEMIFHHLLTVCLYWGMITQNFIRVGVVISWLHQFSDITTAGTRFLTKTVYKNSAIVAFILCIIHWMWMRNYWVPKVSYYAYLYATYPEELKDYQIAPNILIFMLGCLCVLHLYWCCLFLNMLYQGIKGDSTDDHHSASMKKKEAPEVIVPASEIKDKV